MSVCRWILLCATLGVVLSPTTGRAKILDTTRSAAAGQLSLAGEFEANLADNQPLNLNLHERVGLRSGLDLVFDQTFRVADGDGVLLAVGAKWTLVQDTRQNPGVAVWASGLYDTGREAAGFRGHLMVDNTWGRFTPYGALDLDIIFDNDTFVPLTVIAGTRIGLEKRIAAFVEGGLGVNEDTHFLSAGLRVSL